MVKGRRTLQRLLTAPITVTPTETGFEFAGTASWLGYDEQLRAAVMKKEQLTGRLERRHRRSQIWWPRGDSLDFADPLVRVFSGVVRAA